MFMQSKKVIQWTKKNYVVTILNFVMHTLIMAALSLVIVFINEGGAAGFVGYFSNADNVSDLLYLLLFFGVLDAILYLYLYFESRDFLIKAKNITMLFSVMYLSLVFSFVLGKYLSGYARPIALCSLLVLLLVNKRTAIFMNFIFALIMFVIDVFVSHWDMTLATSCLIIAETVSIIAIYLIDGIGSRIKVFGMGLIIAMPIAVFVIVLQYKIIGAGNWQDILMLLLNSLTGGLSSVVIMMAVLPIFEWMFNLLTNYRLVEITDHKSKLIKKLIEEAGGTFNHSLLVATLAETCATAIDENPILARAAAYYHDIGKLKQPIYFTENQHGFNPHDDLTPELSTEIIRSHTKDGYELIKKYHLPNILADVAREHHGTLPIQYFYAKALKYTDEEQLDIADFCYPGPKPQSKIAAIIMLADGCEAAVRAHSDRSREKVESVVGNIFEDRMKREQFSDCDITMREIDLVKETLINGLSGVYHDRIKYPNVPTAGDAFRTPKERKREEALREKKRREEALAEKRQKNVKDKRSSFGDQN